MKSELLRHWFACRSGSSILTILSPTLAKPSRDVRAVRATNLEELVLKARYVSKDGVENDLGVAQSIIDDLLAMEVESINRFIVGRLEEMA